MQDKFKEFPAIGWDFYGSSSSSEEEEARHISFHNVASLWQVLLT